MMTEMAQQHPSGPVAAPPPPRTMSAMSVTSTGVKGGEEGDGISIKEKEDGMEMCCIPPAGDVAFLSRLNAILKHRRTKTRLGQSSGVTDGIRSIQGDRFEILLDRPDSIRWFRDLLRLHNEDETMLEQLEAYATRQARRDPRVSVSTRLPGCSTFSAPASSLTANEKDNDNTAFGTFSLILSYGSVPQQAPHIDLLMPHYQFGCLVTDQTPGTIFYSGHSNIQTVDDLIQVWTQMAAPDQTQQQSRQRQRNKPFPPLLRQVMSSHNSNSTDTDNPQLDEDEWMNMRDLLEGYGNVLDPNLESHQNQQPPVLPVGTVMSLPGSVVHAGPAWSSFRAILFFTGSPAHVLHAVRLNGEDDTPCRTADEEGASDDDDEESMGDVYDPDTQYSSVTLCAQLMQLLWPYVGVEERLFLIQRLLDYMRITTQMTTKATTTTTTVKCQTREDPKQEPWRHMAPCRLASFMEQMSVLLNIDVLTKAEKTRYSYHTKKASKDNGLCEVLLEPPAAVVAITPSPKKRSCSSDGSSTTKKQKKKRPCSKDLTPVFDATAAEEAQVQDSHDDENDDDSELARVDLNEYQPVLIPQGLEVWDEKINKWEEVVLFSHQTHRTIILQYPNEYNRETGECVWEGMMGSHGYTLSMKDDSEQKGIMFNGENGILLDADGNTILCRCRKSNTLPSLPCITTASTSHDAIVAADPPVTKTTTTEMTTTMPPPVPGATVHVVHESPHSPVAASETEAPSGTSPPSSPKRRRPGIAQQQILDHFSS